MNKSILRCGMLAAALCCTAFTQAAQPAWNLNDVSLLLPLPDAHATTPALPAPDERGRFGRLLPDDAYALVPTLYQPGRGNTSLYAHALRVTAVRFDPCPGVDSTTCNAELRLVWQPLEQDAQDAGWVVRDAAVHAVHRLDSGQARAVGADLWRLKQTFAAQGIVTDGVPLGVHPAARNPTTATAFRDAVCNLVRTHAGADNLRRITFAATRVPQRWWRFGAIERDADGDWRRVDIPRVEAQSVDIFNVAVADGVGLGAERGLDAMFNVLPESYPEADNIFALINKGYRHNDRRDEPVFRQKLAAVERFRNPQLTGTHDLDCASCHYADAARRYAEARFPVLAAAHPDDTFTNPDPERFDLTNTSVHAGNGRVVRAFGYHDAQPALSQRAIHESALVADWLNRHPAAVDRESVGATPSNIAATLPIAGAAGG